MANNFAGGAGCVPICILRTPSMSIFGSSPRTWTPAAFPIYPEVGCYRSVWPVWVWEGTFLLALSLNAPERTACGKWLATRKFDEHDITSFCGRGVLRKRLARLLPSLRPDKFPGRLPIWSFVAVLTLFAKCGLSQTINMLREVTNLIVSSPACFR